MEYQYYDVLQKKTVFAKEGDEYVKAYNKNVEIAGTFPYYEALSHPDKTLLPSAHKWWKFQHYLWVKVQYLSSIHTSISYQNLLSSDLNSKSFSQITYVLEEEKKKVKMWKEKYQALQTQLCD